MNTPRPCGTEPPKMLLPVITPVHREKTPGRNNPCPCGSGKKAKKCCLGKIKLLARMPPEMREAILAGALLKGSQ